MCENCAKLEKKVERLKVLIIEIPSIINNYCPINLDMDDHKDCPIPSRNTAPFCKSTCWPEALDGFLEGLDEASQGEGGIKKHTLFLNDFTNINDIKKKFQINDGSFEGVNILFASYETHAYEGNAFILYEKDGEYYEVNASHCSCFGLEGQWEPEKADLKELIHRVKKGRFGKIYDRNSFANELSVLLESLIEEASC